MNPAGLLTCSPFGAFPSVSDSGQDSQGYNRTYSYGYSSGFTPDSLLLDCAETTPSTPDSVQSYKNFLFVNGRFKPHWQKRSP